MYRLNQKVIVKPRIWNDDTKEWTFKGNENGVHYGRIGTIVEFARYYIEVRFLANTNLGHMDFWFRRDEIEPAEDDAVVTNILV